MKKFTIPDPDMQEDERSAMGLINGSKDVRYPSLAAIMQEMLKEAPQYSRKRCIFRVPNPLRQIKEKAYTPWLVSIGPLHHNDKRLLPMEAHKLKYLQFFLDNAQMDAANSNLLSLCLKIVKDNETKIRECYVDPIDLSSDDFTQMVLIDSAFIIQLFRMDMSKIHTDAGDYMYNPPFLVDPVLRDILLEENQLPFFILDELYRIAFQTNASSTNSAPCFVEIACRFLEVDHDNNSSVYQLASYSHLLHLLTLHSRPSMKPKQVEGNLSNDDLVFPPATQLHEAGVKFQVIEVKYRSSIRFSMDIDFDKEKWVLKIPNLCVSDATEYISRNLIAFEQLNYGYGYTRHITNFHIFLNYLINSPEDVKLLVDAGIIKNLMGSNEQVSDLINSLDTNAYRSPKGYYYEQISLDLIDHCKKRWPRYRATLMHTYFKHPWAFVSVVYAIFLLLFTVMQVVSGILAIPK